MWQRLLHVKCVSQHNRIGHQPQSTWLIFLPLTVAEDDWAGWKILHGALGEQIELVGDDLFVTNVKYIQRGIDENRQFSID